MSEEEYKSELYKVLQELVNFNEKFKLIVRQTNEVEELYDGYHDKLNKTIGGPAKFAERMIRFSDEYIKPLKLKFFQIEAQIKGANLFDTEPEITVCIPEIKQCLKIIEEEFTKGIEDQYQAYKISPSIILESVRRIKEMSKKIENIVEYHWRKE